MSTLSVATEKSSANPPENPPASAIASRSKVVMMAIIAKVAGKPAIEYFRHDLLGKEVPGFTGSGTAKFGGNTANGEFVTAPALIEFLRQFTPAGLPGAGPGVRNWWSANVVGHTISRPNRIHAVVLFNGNRNDGQAEFLADLNKLLDELLVGGS